MTTIEHLTKEESLIDAVNAYIDFWEWYGANNDDLMLPFEINKVRDEVICPHLPLMSKDALRAIRRGTYSLVFGDNEAPDNRARRLRETALSDILLELSAVPDTTLREAAPLMFSRRFTAKVRRSLFDLALLMTKEDDKY